LALEELRDQLSEQVTEALAKIQETSAYNSLRERYESQTPTVQKVIVAALCLGALFVLMTFPWSYLSSSSDSLAQFETNRELIQGLLHASRSAKEPSPLPPPIGPDQLRASVERTLHENGLVPDQIGNMQAIPESAIKEMAPAGVVATGLAVQIKKVNLNQILELGNLMHNLGPGIKLTGMDVVQSSGQTHYYDLIVSVVHFGIPSFGDSDSDSSGKKGKGKPAAKKADEETEL
jgi:hypothetical protein